MISSNRVFLAGEANDASTNPCSGFEGPLRGGIREGKGKEGRGKKWTEVMGKTTLSGNEFLVTALARYS